MGVLKTISKFLTPPKLSDLTGAPALVKESFQRSKINSIDVLYIDRDFKSCDQVVGTVTRKTKVSIVSLKTPEQLSFFKTCTIFNRTTGKEIMLTVEGYPYSLQLDKELFDEERNGIASEEIGKAGIQLPILIDQLPYNVSKKNLDQRLKRLTDDDYFELTPSLLDDLGNVKLTDGVTDEDKNVVPVTLLIGVCLGMALLAVLQAFAKGG